MGGCRNGDMHGMTGCWVAVFKVTLIRQKSQQPQEGRGRRRTPSAASTAVLAVCLLPSNLRASSHSCIPKTSGKNKYFFLLLFEFSFSICKARGCFIVGLQCMRPMSSGVSQNNLVFNALDMLSLLIGEFTLKCNF